jgi:hypothetical protein
MEEATGGRSEVDDQHINQPARFRGNPHSVVPIPDDALARHRDGRGAWAPSQEQRPLGVQPSLLQGAARRQEPQRIDPLLDLTRLNRDRGLPPCGKRPVLLPASPSL